MSTPRPTAVPWARRAAALPFLAAIRLYQWTLAPLMAGHCRFTPTCSEYALEALRVHHPLRALGLTMRRLARCHPLGGGGFDPVPLSTSSTQSGSSTTSSR